MSKHPIELPDAVLNASFLALLLSLAGWTLVEAWLLAVHAGLRAHLLASAAGLGFAYFSAKRLAPIGQHPFAGRQRISRADLWCALWLLTIGGLLGIVAMRAASLLLLTLLCALYVLPWSRMALCRRLPLPAGVWTWAGMALATFGLDTRDPMFLPLAGWICWACASVTLLNRTLRLRRAGHLSCGTTLGFTNHG
ncbi:hypothetical protein LK542_06455 [Massilia sp. IC2-477]|uniref:hypothetical protein n=1 Tax=Massilia sp. IC2-477 TaxID=2887198 RepID=UPI001D120F1F|nr:hypothetical protein [Massilia sp. IC2-477]MCC2955254.1 hypothetical protein [Massilia sp. IC2-477]